MRRLVIAIATGVFALTACSSLDHGTVTAKKYDPTWISYTQICASYSEDEEEETIGGTTEFVMVQGPCNAWVPYQAVMPDCWELDLKSGNDTGSQCVSESDYDRYQVGQVYP